MRLLAILALVALPSAFGQTADPLKSPDCGRAIDELDAARAAPETRAREIETMRSRAALACFGTAAPAARPGRMSQAPSVVAPPTTGPPPLPPTIAAPPRTLPPPIAIHRPPTVSACDGGGCWLNDGVQLRHVPPAAASASGLCGIQSGLPGCP